MNLVSVIVPIYKVESYLPECLDSILSSTYTELEIILIDDGSPDNCPAICDEYAQRDSRIKVLHQENQGLVAARNAGLNAASGIYVSFVDSDDAISPLMYEKMVSAIERTGADMAASGYCIDRAQLVTQTEQQEGEDHCLTTFDQQLAMLTIAPSVRGFTWTSCYVWNKLYRRAKIRSAFQPECSMCEDLDFNWKYIHSCKKIVLVQHALYMYRMNQQGITGKYKAQRRNPAMIDNSIANAKMWAMLAQNSDIHDAALQNYLDGRSAYVAHGALWRIYATKSEQNYREYCTEARMLLKRHCGHTLRDRATYSFPLRMMCGLCRYCFPIWKLLSRIYGKR